MIDVKMAYYAMRSLFGLSIDLLRADVRISLRLMAKLSHGISLSRKERQLLTRSTADIFRLVPVSVYIVIPLIELLLPVILKFYPKILPLTFKDKMEEQVFFYLSSLPSSSLFFISLSYMSHIYNIDYQLTDHFYKFIGLLY